MWQHHTFENALVKRATTWHNLQRTVTAFFFIDSTYLYRYTCASDAERQTATY